MKSTALLTCMLLALALTGCGTETASKGASDGAGEANRSNESNGLGQPSGVLNDLAGVAEVKSTKTPVAAMPPVRWSGRVDYVVNPATSEVVPPSAATFTSFTADRVTASAATAPAAVEPDGAGSFELLALNTNPDRAGPTGPTGPLGLGGRSDRFHDWEILAILPVADPDTRVTLLASLDNAAETHCRRGTGFMPEYGLRVHEEGHVTDYLVCCASRRVRIFEDGRYVREMRLNESPKATFSAVLAGAGWTTEEGGR